MISVDTLADNTAFAEKESADFPILANPEKDVAETYGVLRQLQSGASVANRWTFYIGEDGKILHIDRAVKPATSGPDMAKTLAELGVAKRQ
jgi:peroxiredoxin Q/BCP